MGLKNEYDKIENQQVLIIAKSGAGKTLATEGIAEEFHKNGYLVLVIADPKDEINIRQIVLWNVKAERMIKLNFLFSWFFSYFS